MKGTVKRFIAAALLVSAAVAGLATAARAQSTDPAPSPVVIVGNTRFAPLFDRVTLAPGQRIDRDLDVGAFSRLGVLAAADSAPNTGRVAVTTVFGPPAVPVMNPLDLAFGGGRTARRSATLMVMGPRLTVGIANHSDQPVEVSLSVFAVK